MKKLKVAILGATGMVGQKYMSMLSDHPYFEISTVTGHKSVGKTYSEAVQWIDQIPLADKYADLEIKSTEPKSVNADFVFSTLPTDAARKVEPAFANAGFPVISEASAYRMNDNIPLLIPEVNPDHVDLIKKQNTSGYIVTCPNCVVAGLVVVLKPLYEKLQINKVIINTMQALSGAGLLGVPSVKIIDNVIPYIKSEEEKIELESQKILGQYANGNIKNANINFSATCTRVPTLDGHMENLHLESNLEISPSIVEKILLDFNPVPQQLKLPSAPVDPIIIRTENDRPQPRLDRLAGSVAGMSVTVGRIRQGINSKSICLTLLTHNTIRGAAGNSVLTAELLYKKGFLKGN
tara:strand:+ start:893 stop:1945 length:1053 start_codon:yes stop_codon:yes gene_type:complete